MKKGFTLIELLVSVGIFTTVMVIALGALLSITEADRKAQTLKTVRNNLAVAIESMSRSIRTGDNYRCINFSNVSDCPINSGVGSTLIAFRASNGNDWGYRWWDSSCANGLGCIQRSTNGGATWEDITAKEVIVLSPSGGSGLTFYLKGRKTTLESGGDFLQPMVTILLRGYVQQTASLKTTFELQTSVTQRIYDQ